MKLESGKDYTLRQIFSGDMKIVIPDLQRDYCWPVIDGPSDNLVSTFLDTLVEKCLSTEEVIRLGLIYGYEYPEGSDMIQLCDGQQRLTTLFLIVGWLNHVLGGEKYRDFLISDFELTQDDHEPRLQYAIRESSLYILSDLVCRYFLKEGNKETIPSEEILPSHDWFYGEYKEDVTITNMIFALDNIQKKLKNLSDKSLEDFADGILNKLTLIYYNMMNRPNGEETFVIINTTGEPLSASQNLKPKVISAHINECIPEIAQRWERIETWFWRNRSEKNGNDTSEAGFKEFLSWVEILKSLDGQNLAKNVADRKKLVFHPNDTSFIEIENCFEAVKFIFEDGYDMFKTCYSKEWLSPKNPISLIEGFRFWPIISYIMSKGGIENVERVNLKRFYELIKNLSFLEKVKNDPKEYIYPAIEMGALCNDVLELLEQREKFSTLLSSEEIEKLTIINSVRDDEAKRAEIEKAFWHLQGHKVISHNIWAGEIMTVIKWSMDKNGTFDLIAFKRYSDMFDRIFVGECDSNIDLTRRALITMELEDYPLNRYSFGWDWEDWKRIISNNEKKLKEFFDILLASNDIVKVQQDMIDAMPTEAKWSEFAKQPYLLDYCDAKHVGYWHDNEGWMLCKRKYAEPFSVRNAHLYHILGKGNGWNNNIPVMGMRMWHWGNIREGNCVVLEDDVKQLFINIFCYRNNFVIQIGKRGNGSQEEIEEFLKAFVPSDDNEYIFESDRFSASIPWNGDYNNITNYISSVVKLVKSTSKSTNA